MLVEFKDFNGSHSLFATRFASQWNQLREALEQIPLHIKPSDQAGLKDTLIFDPIGTNAYIKQAMKLQGWKSPVPLPARFRNFGIHVDLVSNGLLTEVQFSNYPFLLNNVLRSELLFRSRESMEGSPVDALVLVTKGKMFPASQSTLYYQQSVDQMTALEDEAVIRIPTRIVGLVSPISTMVTAKFTVYRERRTSRHPERSELIECHVAPALRGGPCQLTIASG